jgi:hypothetical protein
VQHAHSDVTTRLSSGFVLARQVGLAELFDEPLSKVDAALDDLRIYPFSLHKLNEEKKLRRQ